MTLENQKIIIVDNDQCQVEALSEHLEKESFKTKVVIDPFQTMTCLGDFEPDMFVLDVQMSGLDGFQLCRVLRAMEEYESTPVIFLSKNNDTRQRIKAYEYGCDGFFEKPVNFTEFVLFVKAVFARMGSQQVKRDRMDMIVAGPLALDNKARRVQLDDESIELTPIQFKLIQSLMMNKGSVLSRDALRSLIWPHLDRIESRAIDVHVRRLREKLKHSGSLIETVRGIGYRVIE